MLKPRFRYRSRKTAGAAFYLVINVQALTVKQINDKVDPNAFAVCTGLRDFRYAHKKTRRGPLKLLARPAASPAATFPKVAASGET